MTEQEKRLHRCCFTGHRPEKLQADEGTVKAWLSEKIDQAIADGYTTFITGMAMGIDIWAGQLVVKKKAQHPELHLIAAVPWPGFASRWKEDWRAAYDALLKDADLVLNIRGAYEERVFSIRNSWMIDHSNRVIAYFNGERGGASSTLDYAFSRKIQVVTGGMTPDFSSYVAYDFETTGLSAENDEIIEIGAVRVVNGQEAETFQELVRPSRKEISPQIAALTGISQADVLSARKIDDVVQDFARFAGKDPLVGFNSVAFDSRFLEATGMKMRNHQFDVMLYAMQFQQMLGFKRARVSLRVLSERLEIVNPRAHRALADAMTTARCFERLKQLEEH